MPKRIEQMKTLPHRRAAVRQGRVDCA